MNMVSLSLSGLHFYIAQESNMYTVNTDALNNITLKYSQFRIYESKQ
jgi:hypothetical protein